MVIAVAASILTQLPFGSTLCPQPPPVRRAHCRSGTAGPPADPGERYRRSAFGHVVRLPASCPKHIGRFGIEECDAFPAGYILYDTLGAFNQDTGLAYLPRGIPQQNISNGSFESPELTHLDGAWYSFSASW
jgi:hypothetical protein